jgi:hypothetical protein
VTSRSQKTVAILFSEHANPERYVISKLAGYWRSEGLRVHYLLGTRLHVPADVLILQVDLSVLPGSALRFARLQVTTRGSGWILQVAPSA